MPEKFEPIILCRNDNGRFIKQIKLVESFMADINKMSSDIFQIKENCVMLSNQVNAINWKINSMVANRIRYNLKGINFSENSEKMSPISTNNFAKVIENINEGLFSLINDFKNNMASGDPKVIRDHITMLLLIYQRLKESRFFDEIVTQEQKEMVENQFIECISLFNISLRDAISQNNWKWTYNMCSAFFGGCYGFIPSPFSTNKYLESCMLDFEELKLPKIDCNNYEK